jgi:carbamoyl-phosphate synthase large subunit
MGANILISTIGRRGTLTKIFKQELNAIDNKVVVTDNSPLAPALYKGDNYYLTPRVEAKNYIDTILEICETENIEVVIPLLEQAFSILDKARTKFKESGIKLLLSSRDVFSCCKDKHLLYQYFKRNNIPTPTTYLPSRLTKQLSFPLFIKPRSGQGSKDTFRIDSKQEFNFFIYRLETPIIQEYISGTEYTIDTLSDLEGQCLSAVPRKRIKVKGGEVSKAVTVKEERLITGAKEIAESLGIIGPANIQAIITPKNEVKFIEVNPRFGGGVPLSYQAGVNYPLLITKMVNGEKIDPFIGDFESGLFMLRSDTPLFKSKNELGEIDD